MSGIFSKPKVPVLPPQEAEVEPITTITEEAGATRRRRRKKILASGRESTKISGIRSAVMAALRKRLGE